MKKHLTCFVLNPGTNPIQSKIRNPKSKIACLSLRLIFGLSALLPFRLSAQNISINADGAPPHPSAILDVSSTNKGVLMPRLTSFEKGLIQDPAPGLMVFDITSDSYWYYSNGWQEMNGGSFTIPYTAMANNPQHLFSVTNTFNGLANSASIIGRRLTGSVFPLNFSTAIWGDADIGAGIVGTSNTHPGILGRSQQSHGIEGASEGGNGRAGLYGRQGISSIVPATSMGVWGDNANGLGVVGTSATGIGTYGLSNGNHGVYGYSTLADFAGVKGSHAQDNGIGVMGEIGQAGIGVLGKGAGATSIAGRFENTAPDNTLMALDARHLGMGSAGTFWTSNPGNTSATVLISSHSSGHGLFAMHDSVGTDNSAVRAWHLGTGEGLYAKSKHGDAGKLVIDNILSNGTACLASTLGRGSAGSFTKLNLFGEDITSPAVLIDNYSRSVGLKVKSLFPSAMTAAIDVEYGGYSYAVNINSAKGGLRSLINHENDLAVFAKNDADNSTAIHGVANAYKGTGLLGSAHGAFGTGVLGISQSPLGYGVKGENASDLYAAVTGENTGAGGGVMGINKSSFGYGVIGESGPQHGIAGRFLSSNPESEVSPAIWAHVPSLSDGVLITLVNENNQNDGLFVHHHGTGNIAVFKNANYDEITLSQNGNITTYGNVVVKGNKGIVRSSNTSQQRMETLSVSLIHLNMPIGAMKTETVTFAQPFSSPPVVSLGNIQSGFTGPCDRMTVQIKNVTTTGCTVTMYNPAVSGNPNVSGTWNLLAIGKE